jgi:CHASE2 domain-containing sensor protein
MMRTVLQVAAAIAIAALLHLAGILSPVSNALSDLRFRIESRAVSGGLVLVAMDEDSIRRIGTWPWPRRVYAKAIDRLVGLGASDIAIDVDLSSPSPGSSLSRRLGSLWPGASRSGPASR